MVTKEQILTYLNSDEWFKPSNSDDKFIFLNSNGEKESIAKSFYHSNDAGCQILIRVSEHGTYLNTWVKHIDVPTISLQNLSVVFSNEPIVYKKITEPKEFVGDNGKIQLAYQYFVVEQYEYRLDNLDIRDFKKVINQIKTISSSKVFTDPLKKKPSKRANRKPLTPNDINDNPIPPETNEVHPRQTVVKDNPDYEVDAKGNILKNESADYGTKSKQRCNESLNEQKLRNIIRRVIKEEVDSTVSTLTVDGWNPSETWHPNKRILDRTRKLYDIYAAYEPDPNMAYFNRWLRDFGINVETL